MAWLYNEMKADFAGKYYVKYVNAKVVKDIIDVDSVEWEAQIQLTRADTIRKNEYDKIKYYCGMWEVDDRSK